MQIYKMQRGSEMQDCWKYREIATIINTKTTNKFSDPK